MTPKQVIQKLTQLMDNKCKQELFDDYLELKNNQTKELTDKLVKKYKLN